MHPTHSLSTASARLTLAAAALVVACSEPSATEEALRPVSPDGVGRAELVWELSPDVAGSDWVRDVTGTSDGGAAVAGFSNPSQDGRSVARILRLTESGEVLWDRTFGGERLDLASSIVESAAGGFIVAGMSRSQGEREDKGWIFRLDADGTLLWESRLGGPGSDFLYRAIETSEGSIVATGYSKPLAGGAEDLWLVEVSSEGELVWERTFGEGLSDWGYGLAEADDGFLVCGASARDGVPDLDGWILGVSPEGDLLWDRALGGELANELFGIHRLPDGDFALAGYSTETPETRTQFWILRLSPAGDVRWEKTFGGPGDDMAMALDVTPAGDLVVTGGTTPVGTSSPDFWTVGTTGDGTIVWEDRRGGPRSDVAHGVAVVDEGRVVVGGYLNKPAADAPDLWILALRTP